MVGAMTETVFVTERLNLEQKGILFLYTDGVTEAKNPEDVLYGEERLLNALQTAPREDLTNLIHYISSEIVHHANGAPQSDDITMLAIKMTRNNVSMEYAGREA
jgi:sigma-B regulation protein RsbU (phosphoserine phosphatase)